MAARTDTSRGVVSIRPGGALMLAGLALLVTTAAPGGTLPQAGSPSPGPLTPPGVQSRLLLRTGDRAPLPGRFGFVYGMALLPGGGLVAENGYGESLVLRDGSAPGRILLHVGDRVPGCGTVIEILQVATGADGSIAARIDCTEKEAIVRVDPAGGVIETPFSFGMIVAGSSVPVGYLWGPAIDGQGRIVVASDGGPGSAALLRQAPGGAAEILMRTGDPIGGGTLGQVLYEPDVNAGGTVVFRAILSGGPEVIATLTPGAPPVVLDSASVFLDEDGIPRTHLGLPTINDAGAVAFLHADALDADGYPAQFRLMRAMGGPAETIVAAGDPAPGGRTFSAVEWVDPVIESTGSVVFGASATNRGVRLYRFDGTSTDIMGFVTEDGEFFSWAGGSAAPLVAPDGSVYFDGYLDIGGAAVLAARDGQVRVVIRPGEPLAEPARFVTLGSAPYPPHSLSAGPFMAPGGGILFDAAVTGGARGLFARAVDGTLSAVVLGGDPAPGGGRFTDYAFSFHSMSDDGRVAFLAIRDGVSTGGEVELFTGPAGGPFVAAARPGDTVPGSTASIASVGPPSRIDAHGAIAVPVSLSDGATALLVWDGSALTRFAASGDTLPDGETIALLRTGEEDDPLPPLLEDSGNLSFGVVTASGKRALYRASLSSGLASATRILGDGDVVEGGILTPLVLRGLTSDASGRIAFRAVPSPGPNAATYVLAPGGTPSRVAGPGDALGFVEITGAVSRLAATTAGIVHETSTRFEAFGDVLWFATPRASTGSGTTFDHVPLNQGGSPSPDGGAYSYGNAGFLYPGNFGLVRPVRIGSDGSRLAVAIEATTAGPQDLVLWDLRPEGEAPVAMAGPDQTVECTGPAGARIALDGRGSSDPASGPLEYTWSSPFATATGPTATMTLPLGSWTISLSVRNAGGLVSSDSLSVAVNDTVPPVISAQASPESLWPAKGQMTPIAVTVSVQDLCSPATFVSLTSISSSDPKVSLAQDVSDAVVGTDDRSFALRARRGGAGRAWTVTYTAFDFRGNHSRAQVTIPIGRPRTR